MGWYLDLARHERELSRAALEHARTAEARASTQPNPILSERLRAEARRQDHDSTMYALRAQKYEGLAVARGEHP